MRRGGGEFALKTLKAKTKLKAAFPTKLRRINLHFNRQSSNLVQTHWGMHALMLLSNSYLISNCVFLVNLTAPLLSTEKSKGEQH